jgi:hypothetical protein
VGLGKGDVVPFAVRPRTELQIGILLQLDSATELKELCFAGFGDVREDFVLC